MGKILTFFLAALVGIILELLGLKIVVIFLVTISLIAHEFISDPDMTMKGISQQGYYII